MNDASHGALCHGPSTIPCRFRVWPSRTTMSSRLGVDAGLVTTYVAVAPSLAAPVLTNTRFSDTISHTSELAASLDRLGCGVRQCRARCSAVSRPDILTVDERLGSAVAAAEFVRDPYPAYRDFRAAPGWHSPAGYQVFSGYHDVIAILRDHATFGQEGIPYPNFHVLDPPDHTRLRRLVAKPFTQRAANRQEAHITEIVDGLIDEASARGRMDLMTDFALRLPARVAASMFAIPIEDSGRWNQWLWDIGRFRGKTWYSHASSQDDQDAAKAAATDSAEYFRTLIDQRKATRGSDIVSGLLDAREGDDKLTDEEILFSLVLLLGGSLHTK